MDRVERDLARRMASGCQDIAAFKCFQSSFGWLRRMGDLASYGVGVLDSDLRYVYVNEILAKFNGMEVCEHLGRRIEDLLPALASQIETISRRVLSERCPVARVVISGPTGRSGGGPMHWLGSFLPVTCGAVVYVAGVVSDITLHCGLEAKAAGQSMELETAEAVLTPTEQDVLALIGRGYTTKQIAAELSRSVSTIGTHRKNLCRKLGKHSTAELVAYAAGSSPG